MPPKSEKRPRVTKKSQNENIGTTVSKIAENDAAVSTANKKKKRRTQRPKNFGDGVGKIKNLVSWAEIFNCAAT